MIHPIVDNSEYFDRIVAGLLQCDPKQISQSDGGPMDDYCEKEEEVYELPPGSEILFEIDNCNDSDCCYGYIVLFKYKGRYYVGECNASPYTFYTRMKDDNE